MAGGGPACVLGKGAEPGRKRTVQRFGEGSPGEGGSPPVQGVEDRSMATIGRPFILECRMATVVPVRHPGAVGHRTPCGNEGYAPAPIFQ